MKCIMQSDGKIVGIFKICVIVLNSIFIGVAFIGQDPVASTIHIVIRRDYVIHYIIFHIRGY